MSWRSEAEVREGDEEDKKKEERLKRRKKGWGVLNREVWHLDGWMVDGGASTRPPSCLSEHQSQGRYQRYSLMPCSSLGYGGGKWSGVWCVQML